MMQITDMTCQQLEDLLAKPEYKAFKRVDYTTLPEELLDGVMRAEAIKSFGADVIEQFDTFISEHNRIPTQKELVDQGLPLYQKFWEDNQYTHKAINGYPFTKGVKLGCMNRIARSYSSRIVELHLELMLTEMGFEVKSHPLLDGILGVDLIIEDDLKRYYLHVTTSKYGINKAMQSVWKKQNRGKFQYNGQWVSFGRDFKKDTILCYSSVMEHDSNSTKWVNNMPLFRQDFIEEQLVKMKMSATQGEILADGFSKLEYFKAWVKATLRQDINF